MNINNLKSSQKELGNINNYIIKDDIGEGNFGKIKLAVYKPTGDQYAIKILNKETIKQKMKNVTFKENEIISKFNHINIINVFELIENKDNYYIIMELCQKGELFDYIVSNKRLSDDEASMFFYQLINGVSYLHSKGISHRDLKPENLLLTNEKVLKIIDFGLSHEYDGNILLKTKCGSPSYAAPEIIKGKDYDGFKIDIWCCGIILYAMVCGYLPFEGETNKELFKSIIDCDPEYPDYLSNNCKRLIKKILTVDPNKRISINEIKQTDFYLKGKDLCKKTYEINLEELDKKSYIFKNEENIENEKSEKIDENKDLFNKIEIKNTKIDIDDSISNKENKNIDPSNNRNKKKDYNFFKEKEKYNIFFRRNEEVNNNNLHNNINTNSIATSFLHHNSLNKHNTKNNNNISNIKKIAINNDNKNKNILQTLQNSRNQEQNNIFQLKSNKINEKLSLIDDIKSSYSNRNKKNKKEIKLLDKNLNEYEKITNKYNNRISIKRHTPVLNKFNSKYNKKFFLDYSNNISHLNNFKNELNNFTDINNKNTFEQKIKNKSVSPKIKKISPIKDIDKILNSHLFYNDINININNLNINNINENNFFTLNKLNEINLLQNANKIKININNINNNENLGNYLKFKNNAIPKSDKRNLLNNNKFEDNDKIFQDNKIINNDNSERDKNNSKKSINKLILNKIKNRSKFGNSIDLSNLNDTKRALKTKILNNLLYNTTDTTSDGGEYNRCNTINNCKNNNWYDNINSEKASKKISINDNSNSKNNKIVNNIFKINKYELINGKKKFKKQHKYQIALKEFINLLKSYNNTNNNNVYSSNKDFLPYL